MGMSFSKLRSLGVGAAALLLFVAQAAAVTLYDAALGSLPSAQGWSSLQLGAAPTQSVAGGAYRLDTTGPGVVYFGNARSASLDTAAGFDLSFSLQVLSEAHTSSNRSGYSMVMVGADPTKALEIAFWSDHVWAYDFNAADGFVHGADAAFDTTQVRQYELSVRHSNFTLTGDGALLLAGALRDYTLGGPPYTSPNFLFFGDDSSRGNSVTELGSVTLTPVPEPASAALLVAGLAGLAGLFSLSGSAAAGRRDRSQRR